MNAPPITLDQLEAAHWLVVGTTGSGKTYLARGLLEQLRRADRRVGAVDKLGKLWGLTLAADGQAEGLEFVIFGGKRPGAIPMTPDQGARLGRIFVERNVPAIFDLSQWKASDQERWVAAFATAVFAANEAALHLMFDEAQAWVPQGGGGPAYEAVRLLAEQGRGNGVNLLLTAPRLSGLDANVRGAIAAMVAMRQTSDVDSKRTAELVAGHLAIDARALRTQLPTLPTGTGFIWSPTEHDLERAAFPANTTFDSSRTPRHGDTPPAPIAISSALVDELRAALAPPKSDSQIATDYPDETIPSDPAAAYAKGGVTGTIPRERDERIADLERRVAELEEAIVDNEAELATLREVDAECDGYNAGLTAIEELVLAVRSGEWRAKLHPENASSGVILDLETPPPPRHAPAARGAGASPKAGYGDSPAVGGASGLPPRQVRILQAIAWSAAYLKMVVVPRGIVAWIADTSAKSSSYANDLGALRSAGLIDYPAAGKIALTAVGREVTPPLALARTSAALWAVISDRLPPRQIAIVEELRDRSPLARAHLAAGVGASSTSSSYANDLGRLRSLGLIDYPEPGFIALAELLR